MTQPPQVKRVLITAGGTGGHVFPALAAAKCFEQRGAEIFWLGTRQGIEAELVPKNGFNIGFLDIAGVQGQGAVRLLLAPFRITKAIAQALIMIRRFNPDLILGMGGFVTGPTGVAGWLSGRPLFIHEQNAIAGMTNRWLGWIARRVFQAFPGAFPAQPKVETTGNPVRQEIVALPAPEVRYPQRTGAIRILILGGSQGAVALNEIVPRALARLVAHLDLEIRHQAGRKNHANAKACYASAGVDAQVLDFIDDMAEAYAWADLVICRSGALTVAELAATGVAALLIPYPHAVDDHQTKNAQSLVKRDAAVMIAQRVFKENVGQAVRQWLQHPEDCFKMGRLAKECATPLATEKVVSHVKEVVGVND